jgi:periplasmic protein TonB
MSEKSPNAASLNEATANDQAGSTAAFNPGDLLASWAAETDSTEAPATTPAAAAAPARPVEQKPATSNSAPPLKSRSHRALRMGISLPVEVQHLTGTREQSQTVFVLARGAVISLTNAVIVGQKVTLKNLKNGKVVECRVLSVDRGLKGTLQTELEFTEIIPEFWPVHFPSEDYGSAESRGRSSQPAPVSSPSLQSHIDSRPAPTTPPISPSFDKPAASSKPVELVPLAGSLAGQKAELTPAIESPVAQNKTPIPGTYSTSDVRAAELAASSIDNKAALRKTPVPGTHTINDFRRVEAAPSVELKVRNTPLPGVYTANDVHAMELKGSGVEIKARNTPVPGTYSVNDFRSTESPVARPHSTAYSHPQHRRTEASSSGGGMKWMVLCAAVVLIAAGVMVGPKFLHRQASSAHAEAAPTQTVAAPATEKLTASEPAAVPAEPATPNAQTSAPTLHVEEPAVEIGKENKTETKLEARSEAKPEPRLETKSTPSVSHQTSTKPAKSAEEQHGLSMVKQSNALAASHRQTVATDEAPPAPVLPAEDSALVANSQPPAVLTGVVTPPAPASAPRTVSHIQAPRLINAIPPQYPAIAKQNRIQGDVTIEMDIDANGNVIGEKVLSGPPFLQAAAKDAVRRWKYEPATLNDKPITYHMQVKVHFALQ